jgi:hypothetical protein
VDEAEHTTSNDIAERAAALAARAQELAARANEAHETEEELATLERELAELDAEERALDDELDGPTSESRPPDWTESLARGLDTSGDMVRSVVDQAMSAFDGDGGDQVNLEQAVEGTPAVSISSGGGAVSITAGAAGIIRVQGVRRGRRGEELPPAALALRDGMVYITTPRSSWRSRPVRLTIQVPKGCPLDLRTSGGGIDVAGVDGPLRAKTGGGGVLVADTVGRVDLTTGGGSIEVIRADGEVRVRTGGGSVQIEGRLSGDCAALTGGGSITVAVRPGTSLEVRGHGHGYAATSEVPGVTSSQGRLEGRIGDGTGGALRLRTGGGAVRIVPA